MFTGFTEETIQFFLDLKFHNNTAFFHEHHDDYVEKVQHLFYEMINGLAPDMLTIDPGMETRPHKCLSRIHRDTRFSRDKSPYRDHLWFIFRRAGEPREKSLNYFFELGPDRLNWGLGFWGENREVLDRFRKQMQADPKGMEALIRNLDLDRHKMILDGTFHRRMAIPPEIPEQLKKWYLARDMYIGKTDPDYRMIYSDRILKEVRKDFRALSPLYRLLRGYADGE